MPPISMFDDELGSYPDASDEDFLDLYQPHDSDPKGIDSALLQPNQPAAFSTTLSPTVSDQDSASDSSPSPNNMNNPDEDFDMFSYPVQQNEDWSSQFDDFTNFGDPPPTEPQNTINPSLIQGDFSGFPLIESLQSSSPSDSNSSNGLSNDSDESPSTEPIDAIMHKGFPNFTGNVVNGFNGVHATTARNGIAKPTRSSATQSRKKRNSVRLTSIKRCSSFRRGEPSANTL